MSAVLRADGVRVRLGGREVLRGVDLELRAGEMLGVVGPNGSGKSTLVRALSRAVPLSGGAVYLRGRAMAGMGQGEQARVMGVVPQATPMPFAFTVGELVAMGRYPHAGPLAPLGPGDWAAVEAALEQADIAGIRKRRVDELSGGELQRAILARALAQRPSVYLLDEPTAHLDLGHQLAVLELMARLCRDEGASVLCVSHDLNLAAEFFGRLILLSEGRVYAEGRPAAIITEAHLMDVYGASVLVRESPLSGRPQVVVRRVGGPIVEPEVEG